MIEVTLACVHVMGGQNQSTLFTTICDRNAYCFSEFDDLNLLSFSCIFFKC